MFLTSEVLSFFSLGGIYSDELKRTELFKAWIFNNRYRVLQSSCVEFEISPYVDIEFKNSLINDANRFICSSVETMIGIENKVVIPKSTAWILVELYYSAFYSVHALLRLTGNPFVQLEREYTRIIEANYSLYNPTPLVVEKGLYCFSYNNATGNLYAKKYKDSHTDLWFIFFELLNNIQIAIRDRTKYPILDDDLISFNLIIDYIKTILNHDGCNTQHNWLSIVRNRINYQHSYGVWYPFERHFNNEYIILLIKKWSENPASIILSDQQKDIDKFIICCLSIVSITIDFTETLSDRISKKALINTTFKKLLNLVRDIA